MKKLVLLAFALSGAAALVYEVAWTRELALILGSTTYALSTMLATFMAGLAIGGFLGGRVADRSKDLIMIFAGLEFLIGLFGLITLPLISIMPKLYIIFYKWFHLAPTLYYVSQFILCSIVMIIPTTLMGATFPVVSRLLATRMDDMGKWVGNAYSANTTGAIVGSLAAGFLLIPLVGVSTTTLIAASLNLLVAVVMFSLSRKKIKSLATLGFVMVFAVTAGISLGIKKEETWFVNYYNAFKAPLDKVRPPYEDTHELLYNKDFPEGRVKAWRASRGYLTIRVSGKQEAGGSLDIPTSVLLSYLPMAAHQRANSFLNIGLGIGISLTAAKAYIEDVSLVELNPGVVEAIGQFGQPGLFSGVDITINDARNHLFLTNRKYDIIASTPSYPAEAGSGRLFTREMFELAADRLSDGGVYSQWVPTYLLNKEDGNILLKTFHLAFPYVYVMHVELNSDLIFIGSRERFRFSSDEIADRVAGLNDEGLKLGYSTLMTPDEVSSFLAENSEIKVNTDDLPILEFKVARRLVAGLQGE